MNLFKYIQGIRKGREINRLEREAMKDPFLADVLEGYDKVYGDHEVRIKRMQDRISARTRPSNHTFHYWTVAASILLIIGIGGGSYFLWNGLNQSKTMLVAESTLILPDTAISENLEEPATSISSEMKYVPKNDADKEDKQPDLISDTQQYEEVELKDLSEYKVIVEAPQADVALSAEKEAIETDSLTTPQPVIGIEAYNEYLKNNLIPPTDDECKNVAGVVTLSFFIDKNGHPYDFYTVKSLCPLADREATRLVKEGPLWTISESVATVNVYF